MWECEVVCEGVRSYVGVCGRGGVSVGSCGVVCGDMESYVGV